MNKETQIRQECCDIWNKLKDKTKMIDYLIESKQRIAELEEQLKNAIVLESDHYVIITNAWKRKRKHKRYGIAKVSPNVQYYYTQETKENLGSYIPCSEFGMFTTKEEAQAKLEELKRGEINE